MIVVVLLILGLVAVIGASVVSSGASIEARATGAILSIVAMVLMATVVVQS